MDEKPAEAVRGKPDSSLVVACRAVADGRADAVVSAGNTGAMLAAGLLEIRRLPGVARPAIAVVIPSLNGPTVLIDAGANADARAGAPRPVRADGRGLRGGDARQANPEVRLLSIGEEDEKGNQLTLEALALLRSSDLRFAGNAESRELLRGATRRPRLRRLHGQRHAEAPRGDDQDASGRASRRDLGDAARQARRAADPARRRAGCASGSTRTPTAAPTSSACAASS